jgi:hypothetical protein
MARIEAQPNWWLANQHQTPEQWAYRLACLEAICATLARCCDGEQPRGEDHRQARPGTADAPDEHRPRRRRTPPNTWRSRHTPRAKKGPPCPPPG